MVNSDNIHESGAVRAMYNLHISLRAHGITSKLLCGSRTTQLPDVQRIKDVPPRFVSVVSAGLNKSASAIGLKNLANINSFFLPRSRFFQESDILHFHSIHNSRFSYASLPFLTKKKPAIFTLHDIWPVSGHCAVSYECERWKIGCGRCPYLNTWPSIRVDNTRLEWYLKSRSFAHSPITFVAPSTWMLSVLESSHLAGHPRYHIPNGIDMSVYRPLDRDKSRTELGIPLGKKVIMAGSINVRSFGKGGDLLIEAIRAIPRALKEDCILVVMGKKSEVIAKSSGMNVVDLGYIENEQRKVSAYSSADLFVHPTRSDNLPLTLQESMACGTPMVSFRVGGVADLVREGITGRLAAPENVQEFSTAIVELLDDDRLRESMRVNCREIATSEYSAELATRRYIELYNDIAMRN